MPQCNTCRVEATKRAPYCSQMWKRALPAKPRYNLAQHILFILHMAGNSPAPRNIFCIPAFAIDRVHAEQLQFAVLYLLGNRSYHSFVFELIEAATRGWEDDRGQPSLTEDQQLHLSTQRGRKPLMVLPVHTYASARRLLC